MLTYNRKQVEVMGVMNKLAHVTRNAPYHRQRIEVFCETRQCAYEGFYVYFAVDVCAKNFGIKNAWYLVERRMLDQKEIPLNSTLNININ